MELVSIDKFLELSRTFATVDVRSPVEFNHAHMSGSVNIPLFSDDERAAIGTAYKNEGPGVAIKLGEGFAEPKKSLYLSEASRVAVNDTVLVLCARGGMRSGKIAEFLEENGFKVYRLEGGYKRYRNEVLDSFARPVPLKILGGKTGCGKTDLLLIMADLGEAVIDLEGLANHRGSAFGSLGLGEQPSTEQFENDLYSEIRRLGGKRKIWVEDESLNIGRIFMPKAFYDQMRDAPLVLVEMDRDIRIKRLCADYGHDGTEPLIEMVGKIRRRLGDEKYGRAVTSLRAGNLAEAASLILGYYDKCYEYALVKKNRGIEKTVRSADGDLDLLVKDILEN